MRALAWALLISVVAHLVLLLGGRVGDAGSRGAFLRATMAKALPLEPATAAPSPSEPSRDRSLSPLPAREPLPRDAAIREASGKTASAAPPAKPIADSGEEAAPSATGLREYRLALAVAAFRLRGDEPEMSWAVGGVRRAEVDLRMASSGTPARIEMASGSGDAAFDQAALRVVGRAARQAAVPDALRGRGFGVRLVLEAGGERKSE